MLDSESVDDLLYSARTADLESLRKDVTTLAETNASTPYAVLLNAIDEDTGNSVAHYAAANGQFDVLSFLIECCSRTSQQEKTALLCKANAAGSTPLHYAAVNGQLEAVKVLLAAVGGESDEDKKNAAELAARKNKAGHDAAYEAERAGREEVVAYLLGVMAIGSTGEEGQVDEKEEEAESDNMKT